LSGENEGERREEGEGLIGVDRVSNAAGNQQIEERERSYYGGGHGRDWREEGDDPDRWVPPVSRKKQKKRKMKRGWGAMG
jgi:hypothetical protein